MSEDRTYEQKLAEYQQRYDAAYAAFSHTFELKRPRPAMPRAARRPLLTLGMIVLMLVCNVIVSGSRTIPEFGPVGFFAFGAFELGMTVYSFVHTLLYFDEKHHASMKRNLALGIWLAFIVLLAANIDQVLTEHNVLQTMSGGGVTIVNLAIFLVIAVGAPFLAKIAGEVLATLEVKYRSDLRKLQTTFDEQAAEWRHDLNGEWEARRGRMGIRVPSVEPERLQTAQQTPIYLQTGLQTAGKPPERSPRGYQRQKALDWLLANEDKANLTIDELYPLAETTRDGMRQGRLAYLELKSRAEQSGTHNDD